MQLITIIKGLLVKLFFVFSVFILTSLQVSSKTTIMWGTDVWGNFTDIDGSGFYHQLMSEIFPENEYKLESQYLPWKRTLKYLEQGKIDTTGALPLNNKFYFSDKPVLTETIYAVFRKSDDSSCCEFDGQTGSYRHGYDQDVFYAALPSTVKGIGVESVAQGIDLLLDGKIDFYVDIGSVLQNGLSEKDTQKVSLKPIGNYQLHWAFTRSDKGFTLKKHFDQIITELNKSGELNKLYLKYGLNMPSHY
ncbi:transporter substrate-binding domain-containing protein [Alteromonadaceae bacterium BrNp21-10]|nr:transporter substrate-binding domain-containing protein [Alteromonadaceae bacterium BrNp21-10]